MTLSVGISTSPNESSSAAFLMRSSRPSLARFSCPEYVWTTYHFSSRFSLMMGAACISLAVDDLGDPRPHEVEEAEDDRRDDRHDDHDDGGRLHFLAGRPADLLELGGDLVDRGVCALVAVQRSARDD